MPTRENAKALLPIIQAYVDGKEIQFFQDGVWEDRPGGVNFECFYTQYRIKPEPILVPMTSQELPPVFWVRSKNPDGRFEWLVTGFIPDGSFVGIGGLAVNPGSFAEYEWSPDRKTWNSFMKEAEA